MSPPGRCVCSSCLSLPWPLSPLPLWLGHSLSLTMGLTGWGLESNSGPDHVSHSAFRAQSPPHPLAQPSHSHLREGQTLYPRPRPLLPLRETGERPCGVERTPFWLALETLDCQGTSLPSSSPCFGQTDVLAISVPVTPRPKSCTDVHIFSVDRMNHSSSQGQTYVLGFFQPDSSAIFGNWFFLLLFFEVVFSGFVDTSLDQDIMGLL